MLLDVASWGCRHGTGLHPGRPGGPRRGDGRRPARCGVGGHRRQARRPARGCVGRTGVVPGSAGRCVVTALAPPAPPGRPTAGPGPADGLAAPGLGRGRAPARGLPRGRRRAGHVVVGVRGGRGRAGRRRRPARGRRPTARGRRRGRRAARGPGGAPHRPVHRVGRAGDRARPGCRRRADRPGRRRGDPDPDRGGAGTRDAGDAAARHARVRGDGGRRARGDGRGRERPPRWACCCSRCSPSPPRSPTTCCPRGCRLRVPPASGCCSSPGPARRRTTGSGARAWVPPGSWPPPSSWPWAAGAAAGAVGTAGRFPSTGGVGASRVGEIGLSPFTALRGELLQSTPSELFRVTGLPRPTYLRALTLSTLRPGRGLAGAPPRAGHAADGSAARVGRRRRPGERRHRERRVP